MDEGSKATDDEYERYVARFFNIFPIEEGVKVCLICFHFM